MKVMYVSGYTDNIVAQKFLQKPGTVFLQKPFPLETLGRQVRETLEGMSRRDTSQGFPQDNPAAGTTP